MKIQGVVLWVVARYHHVLRGCSKQEWCERLTMLHAYGT